MLSTFEKQQQFYLNTSRNALLVHDELTLYEMEVNYAMLFLSSVCIENILCKLKYQHEGMTRTC